MKIADLKQPVLAAKADWIAASTWLGFTPTGGDGPSRAKCQATIQRQMNGGYVLEYITETAEKPNSGFEKDTRYLEEKAQHQINKGRLLAVHKLRHTSRSLDQILGPEEFARLQDMWAQGAKRWRWSVAFPIVDTFEIVNRPKAVEVFGETSYRRLFAHSSATLRPLTDEEMHSLAMLEIVRIPAENAWIAVEDDMLAVEASSISPKSMALIEADLKLGALEGESDERKAKLRRRAAWLADIFIRRRKKSAQLYCDVCKFDPSTIINSDQISLRSALDVHHKFPLEEGRRYTTIDDFSLLCPTCHRLEHQLMKSGGSFFDRDKAPHLFAATSQTSS